MIRRRFLLCAPALLVFAFPAQAAEKGDDKAGDKKKETGPVVDLQPVGMPVVVNGQLVNYVFVSVRLNLGPNQDVPKWRAKEPFFRDALVRAGYATPFVLANDYEKIDTAKLCAEMMRQAAAIAGPGVVRSVVVTRQTPSRHAKVSRS